MRRPVDDDEEERSGWFGRFVRGGLVSVLVSAVVIAGLSIFVLPPPEPPAPEPESAGLKVIGGIEVSADPAYSGTAESGAAGSGAGAAAPAEEALAPVELSGPALTVNAAPFEADPATPLVAVVVDDTAAAPLLHEALFTLEVPLTIGVVAGGGGDREIAEAARTAGFEVVAELPIALPGQSAGGELEYGLPEQEAGERSLTLMRRLPVAVAVARPLASEAPPNLEVLRGMAGAVAPLGFAYLDHGVAPGENSIAESAGVSAIVAVARYVIPAGASAPEAHAVLDRASAAAAEEGTAVVIAQPSEGLILALQLWGDTGLANPGEPVPAPLSAVIRRQRGG
jgi:polysaccharide deacetylase 2 family uncharacterized protein YibQ